MSLRFLYLTFFSSDPYKLPGHLNKDLFFSLPLLPSLDSISCILSSLPRPCGVNKVSPPTLLFCIQPWPSLVLSAFLRPQAHLAPTTNLFSGFSPSFFIIQEISPKKRRKKRKKRKKKKKNPKTEKKKRIIRRLSAGLTVLGDVKARPYPPTAPTYPQPTPYPTRSYILDLNPICLLSTCSLPLPRSNGHQYLSH